MGEVVRPELFDQRSDTGKNTDWVNLGMASNDKSIIFGAENGGNASIAGGNFSEAVTEVEIVDDYRVITEGSRLAIAAMAGPLQLPMTTPAREQSAYTPPQQVEIDVVEIAEQTSLSVEQVRKIKEISEAAEGVSFDQLLRQAVRSPRIRRHLE